MYLVLRSEHGLCVAGARHGARAGRMQGTGSLGERRGGEGGSILEGERERGLHICQEPII